MEPSFKGCQNSFNGAEQHLAPLLQNMAESGGITQLLKNDTGFRSGAYLYNGILTNETLGQKFNILSKDLDLLLTAF